MHSQILGGGRSSFFNGSPRLFFSFLLIGLIAFSCNRDGPSPSLFPPNLKVFSLVNSLSVGESTPISVQYFNEYGQIQVTQQVGWTSSDTSLATVDANGLVRGIAPGTATITISTITGNGQTLTKTVKVSVTEPTKPDPPESTPPPNDPQEESYDFVVDPLAGPLHLVEDDKYALSYSFGTEKGKDMTDRVTVQWRSSQDKVVDIEEEARLSLYKVGSVTITGSFTYEDTPYVDTIEVEVQVTPRIAITNPIERVFMGDTHRFECAFWNESEIVLPEQEASWESSDDQMFMLDKEGSITPMGMGKAWVRIETMYQGNRYMDSVQVEVVAKEDSATHWGS